MAIKSSCCFKFTLMLILAAIQKMIIDYYSALNNDQVTMSMILVAEIQPFHANKNHFICHIQLQF